MKIEQARVISDWFKAAVKGKEYELMIPDAEEEYELLCRMYQIATCNPRVFSKKQIKRLQEKIIESTSRLSDSYLSPC